MRTNHSLARVPRICAAHIAHTPLRHVRHYCMLRHFQPCADAPTEARGAVRVCVCACVRACARARARVCVRAFAARRDVRACVRACVRVKSHQYSWHACARARTHNRHTNRHGREVLRKTQTQVSALMHSMCITCAADLKPQTRGASPSPRCRSSAAPLVAPAPAAAATAVPRRGAVREFTARQARRQPAVCTDICLGGSIPGGV
jgi:hypothetical protein